MEKTREEIMEEYARTKIAPVMIGYTKWVVSECQRRGLKKIYFLARDGFVLCDIAKAICEKNNIDIDCRYLYCSRFSLRMPTLHFLGEEAKKILFMKGFYYSADNLLDRANLSPEEKQIIFNEIGVSQKDKVLSLKEHEQLVSKLEKSERFWDIVDRKSKEAYANAIKYFKEQGLFDDKEVVIVDSGWTGSMQRSLRQLLSNEGYNGKIIGFYFGIIKNQKEEDGEYLTFYFNRKKGLKRKVMFNSNLFECMLSANHGMTIGYKDSEKGMIPVLKEIENKNMLKLIELQISNVLKTVKENEKDLLLGEYNLKKSVRKVYRILKRIMVYPTIDEVKLLSNFVFCDDTTEGYHVSLADEKLTKELKSNMFLNKIFRKAFKTKKSDSTCLFWPYGVIALQPRILRPWYRINIMLWDFLRLF